MWLFRCREGPYLPSPNEVSLAVFCFRKCAGLRCFPSCPYFVFCSFVRVLVAVLSPFHSPLPPFVYIAKKPRSEKLPRRAITWVYRPAKHTGHPGSAPGVSSCVSFCSVLCLSFVMVIVNSKSPHSWPRNNFMPHNITQPHTLKTVLIPNPGCPAPRIACRRSDSVHFPSTDPHVKTKNLCVPAVPRN